MRIIARMGLSGALRPFLVVSAICGLFLANAAALIGGSTTRELFRFWRSSDDFAIAAGYGARQGFPVAPYRVLDTIRRERDPRFVDFRRLLDQQIALQDVTPSTFWRTVPPASLSPDGQWRAAARFDDGGRALFLGLCYRALGGAAPFLLFWLGILICVPLLVGLFLECRWAGHGIAGGVLIALLSCSAFFVEMLALGYSAVGFHVMALLVLLGLAVYGLRGQVTVRGLVVRSLVAGVLIGVFSLARGTVPSLLPAFVLALGAGAWRAIPTAAGRRIGARQLGLLAVSVALLVAPYLFLSNAVDGLVARTMTKRGRPMMPRYHDPALLIWKGLGDFDRTKGYEFRDKAGERAIIRGSRTGDASRAQEIHLRSVILGDIREDPVWFATILVKRALSTITLYKVWAYGPRDGTSIIPAASPNEGVIDAYYSIAAHADWYRLGSRVGELPIVFVLLPTLICLLAGTLPSVASSAPELARVARAGFPVMSILAVGVLATPVLITTATAFEPECFVIVHLLAAGFLAEGVVKARKPPARA